MQPAGTTTTTTTEIWQWQCTACRADWKMLRQVTTTYCPHGHVCRCCQGSPPSAGNPPLPPHHHHHRRRHHLHQEKGTRALAAEGSNTGRDITLQNADPPAVAQACWVPNAYLMVQQLREFESLNDELVALRVQLQEYAEEIERSIKRNNDGTNWLLALPANVRDVLVMAKDTIESFVAISATTRAN